MDDCRLFYQKYLDLAPFESPFSFRKHSTIGCGGFAKIAFYPRTIDEMVSLLSALEKDGRAYVVLGALSNVLPRDGALDKVVVSTRRLLGVSVDEKGTFVLAGTTSGGLLRWCKEKGLSGAEFLVGIPCTIGGAAYMNAGAAGIYFDEIVKTVVVYRDGTLSEMTKSQCRYAYKHSAFMADGGVIVGVYLDLHKEAATEIERRVAYYLERRKSLPKGRSMGCVFKNPQGDFAGRLIEESGLKGERIGGAYVSDQHANFILMDGDSAQDVKALIDKIKKFVFQRTGVVLEEEIVYL